MVGCVQRGRCIFALGLITFGVLMFEPASAQIVYNWQNGAGGAFGTASNWSPADTAPPHAGDTALFGLGATYTVTGSGTATNLAFEAGNVTLSGAFSTDSQANLTALNIAGGTLNLASGSTLTVNRLVQIGRKSSGFAGAGVLNVGPSSTLTVNPNSTVTAVSVGTINNGTGTANVDGANAVMDINGQLVAGGLATGTVNVRNGGLLSTQTVPALNSAGVLIGQNLGVQGTVLVEDALSRLDNEGQITVGGEGAGELEVRDGGTINTGGSANYPALLFGFSSGGSGNGTVGNGGTLNAMGQMVIGGGGTGTFTIEAGGTVASQQVGALPAVFISNGVNANGTATMNGGDWDVTGDVVVGGSAGQAAVVLNAGNWNVNGDIMLIGTGAHGTVTVKAGATLDTSAGAGLLTLGTGNGFGEMLILGGELIRPADSSITVGLTSRGRLEIRDGSQVTDARVRIAQSPSSLPDSSEVIVSGAGSTLTLTTDLTVGIEDSGELHIEDGGQVTVAGANAAIAAGVGATGLGNIQLSGGSALDAATAPAIIAGAGQASLTVSEASQATFETVTVGQVADSMGSLYVTGAGSTVQVGGELILGDVGNADASIDTDGAVEAASVVIARSDAGGAGSLNIESSGTLTVGGDLVVGDGGSAFLYLRDGGVINATTGNIVLGQSAGGHGVFNLYGGAALNIAADIVIGEHGAGVFTLNDNAAYSSFGAMSLGENADSSGDVYVNTDSAFTVNGSLTLGKQGYGGLTVSSGAAASAAAAVLGEAVDSTGAAVVTDAGSTWSVDADLIVGKSGNGAVMVKNGGSLHVGSGTIVLGELADGSGDLTISDTGSLAASYDIVAGQSGSGNFSLQASAAYTAGSVVLAEQPGSYGSLTVDGGSHLQVSGDLIGGKQGNADINVLNGGHLTMLANPLVLAEQPGSSVTMNVNDAGSVLHTPSLHVGGSDNAAGGAAFVFTYNGGQIYVADTLNTWGGATVNVAVGGSLTIGDDTTPAVNAQVRVNDGGTLAGNGTIVGNVLNAAGSISPGHSLSPGHSPGTLTIDGAFQQLADGTLQIQLGGAAPELYDHLNASGSMTLSGALIVASIDGFAPAAGQSFNILSGDSISGTFSSIVLPTLLGSLTWNTSELYTMGVIAVDNPTGVMGDFDSDGDVDGADFVAWQTHYPTASGATLAQGDANGDGKVNGADFAIWQANFPTAPGAGAAPVPEPAAGWLGSILALWIIFLSPLRFRACLRR